MSSFDAKAFAEANIRDTEDKAMFDAALEDLGTPDFPLSREGLLQIAERKGAREAITVAIRSLPKSSYFDTMGDFLHALGVGSSANLDSGTRPEPH